MTAILAKSFEYKSEAMIGADGSNAITYNLSSCIISSSSTGSISISRTCSDE